MTKEERKAQKKADNAAYRAAAAQLLTIAIMGGGKAERYLAAADACDQVAERLRERAAEA